MVLCHNAISVCSFLIHNAIFSLILNSQSFIKKIICTVDSTDVFTKLFFSEFVLIDRKSLSVLLYFNFYMMFGIKFTQFRCWIFFLFWVILLFCFSVFSPLHRHFNEILVFHTYPTIGISKDTVVFDFTLFLPAIITPVFSTKCILLSVFFSFF